MRKASIPMLLLLAMSFATPVAAALPPDATAVIYAKGGCTASDLFVVPANVDQDEQDDGTPPQDDSDDASPTDESPEEPTDGTDGNPTADVPDVILSEFLPDPEGTDADGEFLELENRSTFSADLTGWLLRDGKDRVFSLDGIVIPVSGHMALPYATTHLSLTNTGFSMSLVMDDGTIRDAVDVGPAVTGESYAFNGTAWLWTTTPTPGEVNEFPAPAAAETVTDSTDQSATAESGGMTEGSVSENEDTSGTSVDNEVLTIADLSDHADNELVTVAGTVSLPSGRAAKTIFAFQDDEGVSGAFVRMYGTTRPVVPQDAEVLVTGRLRRDSGVLSLNAIGGGVTVSPASTPLSPSHSAINDITEDLNGVLISVTGAVVDTGTSWVLLSDPSGTKETTVRLPDGVPTGPLTIGDTVTAVGTVRYRNGIAELLAMTRTDIAPLPAPDSENVLDSEDMALFGGAIAAANAGAEGRTILPSEKTGAGAGFPLMVAIASGIAYVAWRGFAALRRKKRATSSHV